MVFFHPDFHHHIYHIFTHINFALILGMLGSILNSSYHLDNIDQSLTKENLISAQINFALVLTFWGCYQRLNIEFLLGKLFKIDPKDKIHQSLTTENLMFAQINLTL